MELINIFLLFQQVSIPSYSESEYNQYLKSEDWSQAETDHLMDLCQRFDLRFIVIHDRWDRAAFRDRSVEDLKERYYHISATLGKVSSLKYLCHIYGATFQKHVLTDFFSS